MINKHKSNKIKENSNTVRHLNNGTDHRRLKSCCDQSSPARRTITTGHACSFLIAFSMRAFRNVICYTCNWLLNNSLTHGIIGWNVNPLRAKLFRWNIKHIFTFHVIPLHWYDTGGWNPSSNKTRAYSFYSQYHGCNSSYDIGLVKPR